MNPVISIIIPCRNEEQFIEKNIRSCFSQTYGGEIEVLVVDGMSTDSTQEIVANLQSEYAGLKLVLNKKQTTPFALNIGIEECKGEFFVILGGHAELTETFIEYNYANFSNDSIGCTGGIIDNVYLNNTGKVIGKAMSSMFGVGNAMFRTGGDKSIVDTVAFGMYRKSIIESVGVFDESLVRNQDDEYNFRVSKEYDIVFDPAVVSKYYVRGNFTKLFKQYYQYGYWKVYVNQMHRTITSWRQLIPAILILCFGIGIPLAGMVPEFFLLFCFFLNVYVGAAMIFAGKKCASFKEWALITYTFFILHVSYGVGYWKGIIDFLILRKKPTEKSKQLSR